MASLNSSSKLVTNRSLWVGAIATSLLASSFLLLAASPNHAQTPPIASSDAPAETAGINRGVVLAIALGGSVALGVGLNAALKHKRSSQPLLRLPSGDAYSHHPTTSFDQVSRPLHRQLLLLLHQDKAAAQRLFNQVSVKYPGKSANWYAEKVIFDLERDRGRV